MIAIIVTTLCIYAIAYMAGSLAMPAGLLVLVVTMGVFGFALFVGNSLEKSIPDTLWDRLSLSPRAARRLGVRLFNRFLTRIGWNRFILDSRGDDRWNPRHMKAAAAGHGWGFLLHVATAVWIGVTTGEWASAALLLVIGIAIHLYPVLLQIYVLTLLRGGRIR